MPLPLVRASSTVSARNADRWGGYVFAILDSVPGIVIPGSRVSTEPTHAHSAHGALVTRHGEDQRDDDQRCCNYERDPHTGGNIFGACSSNVTCPRSQCEDLFWLVYSTRQQAKPPQ